MKLLITTLITLFTIQNSFAEVSLDDAPLEWLIVSTLKESLDDHGHIKKNKKLVNNIFNNIRYDKKTDEIKILKNKNLNHLKDSMLDILEPATKVNTRDKLYESWNKESKTNTKVTLYRTTYKKSGHYFFNHIHTNISQDNSSLKFLKISPRKTYNYIDNFLRNRKTLGTTSFTDHDTDIAYDKVAPFTNGRLNTLRGVEWGGKTHMNLIGIKEDWSNLPNGRNYSGEESIKQSRSSDGFRVVNHPNRSKVFSYKKWSDADGVEVWNTLLENSPFLRLNLERSNNRSALSQWAKSLESGKSYTAMAGSDFHFIIPCLRDRSLIYPVNFIPSTDNYKTKEYLFKGRASFLTRPDSPKLTLVAKFEDQKNWSNMGDSINGKGKVQVRLYGDLSDTNKRIGGVCYNTVRSFYRLFTFWKKRFWEIRFYNKKGEVIAKRTLNPKRFSSKKHFKAVFEMSSMDKSDLVRAEVWQVNRKSKSIDLLGATNPIYLSNE